MADTGERCADLRSERSLADDGNLGEERAYLCSPVSVSLSR